MTQPDLPTRTRRSPEIWEAARRDYIAGASTLVIGERYGLAARSVRRRALLERWRRDDPDPVFDPLRCRMKADMDAFPELADVSAIAGDDLRMLLLLPDTTGLGRYAFRKAAESAAMDGPNEAAAWLRVVRLTESIRRWMDVDVRPWSSADYLRASMIESVTGRREPEPEDESAESAMSPEIRVRADSGG